LTHSALQRQLLIEPPLLKRPSISKNHCFYSSVVKIDSTIYLIIVIMFHKY
jgi:hypothetical protein